MEEQVVMHAIIYLGIGFWLADRIGYWIVITSELRARSNQKKQQRKHQEEAEKFFDMMEEQDKKEAGLRLVDEGEVH